MWFENVDGSGTSWAEHDIKTDANYAYVLVGADVNGDGFPDVFAASYSSYWVAYCENPGGDAQGTWTCEDITTDKGYMKVRASYIPVALLMCLLPCCRS